MSLLMPQARKMNAALAPAPARQFFPVNPSPPLFRTQPPQTIAQKLFLNFADYFSHFSILVFSGRSDKAIGRRGFGDLAWAAGIPSAALFFEPLFSTNCA
jgi:hypothetical protein